MGWPKEVVWWGMTKLNIEKDLAVIAMTCTCLGQVVLEYITNLLEHSLDPFLSPSMYFLLMPNPYSFVL